MKINARLKKIGDLVEANSFCLDVGCDHAFLDIYLVKQNKKADIEQFARNYFASQGKDKKPTLVDGELKNVVPFKNLSN